MPNTLFLPQTPYHILLSVGISTAGDTIQIIDDFNGSSYFAGLIRAHGRELNVLQTLPGRATTTDSMRDRVSHSRSNIRTLRGMIRQGSFSKLVLFNDRTPETQMAARMARGSGMEVELLEDGLAAYRPTTEKEPSPIRGLASKVLFGRHYRNIITLGTSPYTPSFNAFLPELVIPQLQAKKVQRLPRSLFESIPKSFVSELATGIDRGIKSIVVLPHSDVIGLGGVSSTEQLKSEIQETVRVALSKHGKVAVKYHPRERKQYLGDYDDCISLPQQVPMEVVYLWLKGNGIEEVIGSLSTSLYTARLILGDSVRIVAIGDHGVHDEKFMSVLGIETHQMS